MPTYDYRCDACGHEFELFQSMKDNPKRKCPECGKNALQRLIGTGAAVLFKGGGFYETDYRSESYKKAAEAEKKSSEPATESKTNTDKAAASKPDKVEAAPKPASEKKAKKSKAKND